jgi:hypothetical protein
MVPEGSLAFPTGPTNCTCPEPHECSPQLSVLHFDINVVYKEMIKILHLESKIPNQ